MKHKLVFLNLILIVILIFSLTGCNTGNSLVSPSNTAQNSAASDAEKHNIPADCPGIQLALDNSGDVVGAKGIITDGLGAPYFTVTESPAGKYVVTINLRPGILYRQYRKVLFSIYNDGVPTGWTVNIGDSSSNDGYGGDYGNQANDAELQINNGTLNVYANDYGSSQLLYSKGNCLPTTGSRNISITVENNKASYWKNFDTSTTEVISSPYLYALAGQSDSEGPVNYTIYAAFNRVINNSSRSGNGITNVYIYLQNEINGTPAYEPNYWNDRSIIQYYNNCYNYGCNKRTDSYAQPGYASGYYPYAINATAVRTAALYDGLEIGNASGTLPEGKSRVALAIWPNYDYHWYRQDRNGKWSHKAGQSPATNLDNSGNIITNPETANRGVYTQFVGYFFVDSDYDQGEGHENIDGPY